MTTVSATVQHINDDAVRVVWAGLTVGDVGGGYAGMSEFSDRSIQTTGTFGVGGVVIFTGSNNDGTDYAVLSDPGGVSLMLISAKIKQVTEYTQAVRPEVTAGDGTTAITVTMVAKRLRRG